MAVTSSGLACSSMSVPTWPGRRPSGGTNSTGIGSRRSSGTRSSAPVALPNATSIGDPAKRRSRPACGAPAAPNAERPRAASRPPADAEGVRAHGEGLGQAPPLLEDRLRGGDRARREADDDGHALAGAEVRLAERRGAARRWCLGARQVRAAGPAKQATRRWCRGQRDRRGRLGRSARATRRRSTLQYSSSWSSKWLSAAADPVADRRTCARPVIGAGPGRRCGSSACRRRRRRLVLVGRRPTTGPTGRRAGYTRS